MPAAVLRRLRESAGFAQQDWAAELGVGRRTVQRWEAGTALPDALAEAAMVRLCLARGIDVDTEILGRTLSNARVAASGAKAIPGSLFGRDGEMAAALELLGRARLVTVTGTGGVGKTAFCSALAAAAVPSLADRVVVAELAGVDDAALVPATLAAAAGVVQRGGTSVRAALVLAFGGPPTLLVVDNLEQVIACASVLADLLASCPSLRVLATSRVPLGVEGERTVELQPLAVPPADTAAADLERWPAAALFVARCRAIDGTFDVGTDDAAAVVEICARLGGLPLALELAAARVRVLPPRALARRLDPALPLLSTTASARPDRHRTLAATIRWSVELLSDGARSVFDRLGVFAGSAPIEAVERVAGIDPVAVFDALDELLQHHLVTRSGADEPRIHLLATVAEHAAGRLATDPDAAGVEARFLRWVVDVAEGAAAEIHGASHAEVLRRVDDESDNARRALTSSLRRGLAPEASRLVVALAPYWDARCALSEARDWIERLLVLDGVDEVRRATASAWGGYFAALSGDLDRAADLATAALAEWRRLGIPLGEAYAELVLGGVAAERGADTEARRRWERSLAIFDVAGDRWASIRPLNNLGELLAATGDAVGARGHYERAIARARDVGDVGGLPNLLCALAHVLVVQGELEGAATAADEALELAGAHDHALHLAMALEASAAVALGRGDPAGAARRLGAAAARRQRIGAPVERRDRVAVDHAMEAALSRLGQAAFDAAWSAGATDGPLAPPDA